jgi:hypothetical protein
LSIKKLPTKTTDQIIVEQENTTKRDRGESKGRVLAISRRIYRLLNTDTYYVEFESSDNMYYFVRYNPSVFEWCSCKDFESNRAKVCKHLYSVEFAIRFGTFKDIDGLPKEAKRYNGATTVPTIKSYRDEDYDY